MQHVTGLTWSRVGLGLVVLSVVGVLLPGTPEPALAHAADGHPARIHQGTCESLGGAEAQLNGVGASVNLAQTPVATPQAINPQSAYQVMTSETTIQVPMATLLSGDHAVMIYNDDQAMQGIACGNVGGAMMGDTLVVGLAEMGTPGHTGFALFHPDGDQTDVTIVIGHALAPVSASGAASGGQGGMDMSMDMSMATPVP